MAAGGTQNGDNGSSAHSPHAMCGFLDDDYLYGTFKTQAGGCLAWRWRRSTGVLQSIDLSTVAGNHLELPVGIAGDSHFDIVPAVDDQDTMFVVGNHHDGVPFTSGGRSTAPTTTHMIQCTNVAAFTNPASWSAVTTTAWDNLATGSTVTAAESYTYHIFERDSAGVLYHFMSQSERSGLSLGRDWICFKRTGGAWSPLAVLNGSTPSDGTFARCDALPPSTGAGYDRVYICGVLISPNGGGTGVDRMHVYGLWRSNDADPTSQKDPFYLYSDGPNFTTWKTAAGVTQPMPIYAGNDTFVGDNRVASSSVNSAPATSEHYRHGVYVDSNNWPSFVIEDGGTGNYVRQAWNGSAWTSTAFSSTVFWPAAGYAREHRIFGSRWARYSTSGGGNRVALRKISDGTTVYIGESIKLSGGGNDLACCPVWLRKYNRYAICVGDGDTPKVWTFGDGARSR